MSTGTELVMLLRGRAPLAVAMTASARPNKVLTPRTTVARSKSGVFGRNIMYFIRGTSDHPIFSENTLHPIFIFIFIFSGNFFRSKIFRFSEQYGVDSRGCSCSRRPRKRTSPRRESESSEGCSRGSPRTQDSPPGGPGHRTQKLMRGDDSRCSCRPSPVS